MERVEILLATRNGNTKELINAMNIQSPVIIASQDNEWSVTEETFNQVPCRTLRTITRGVGINRNIALSMAREDILLFADDDVTFCDGYEAAIVNAFKELPHCDVLIFRMRFTKGGEVYDEDRFETKRIHTFNGLSFGTYQIAIRRKSAIRANLHFSTLFGGGCPFSCGEDSLFLIDCFRSGLKVYTFDYFLGTNRKDSSSWYCGMNEKFFYDKGVFLALAFPKSKRLLAFYFAVRLKSNNDDDLGFTRKMKLINLGIKHSKELVTFEEYSKNNE